MIRLKRQTTKNQLMEHHSHTRLTQKPCRLLTFFLIAMTFNSSVLAGTTSASIYANNHIKQISFSDLFSKVSSQVSLTTHVRNNNQTHGNSSAQIKNTIRTTQLSSNQYPQQTTTHPETPTQNDARFIPIDFASINIKKHELAAMQVLYEICPNLLDSNLHGQFDKGFNQQLHELMPKVRNPMAAMQYLSNQKDYRQILSSMKDWTINSYSNDENRELCQDVVNHRY